MCKRSPPSAFDNLDLKLVFCYVDSTGLKTLPAITRTMQSRQFARISPFESFMRMKEKLFLSKGFAGSIEEKDPGKVIGTSYTIVKYPDPRVSQHPLTCFLLYDGC